MIDLLALLRVAEIDPSVPSLDVHGMRLDEAKHEIDYFLDHLLRDRVRIGKIIHGKGEEILARALPDFLKAYAFVERVHTPSGTHESGAVVYVALRLD